MKVVWLSHVLAPDTPLYGGGDKIGFTHPRSMARGDSCNTTLLGLSSHAGTHVDVPRHFLPAGGAVEHYPPETWLFHSPLLIEISVPPGELIRREDVTPKLHLDQPIDFSSEDGFSWGDRRRSTGAGPGFPCSWGLFKKRHFGLRAVLWISCLFPAWREGRGGGGASRPPGKRNPDLRRPGAGESPT